MPLHDSVDSRRATPEASILSFVVWPNHPLTKTSSIPKGVSLPLNPLFRASILSLSKCNTSITAWSGNSSFSRQDAEIEGMFCWITPHFTAPRIMRLRCQAISYHTGSSTRLSLANFVHGTIWKKWATIVTGLGANIDQILGGHHLVIL